MRPRHPGVILAEMYCESARFARARALGELTTDALSFSLNMIVGLYISTTTSVLQKSAISIVERHPPYVLSL